MASLKVVLLYAVRHNSTFLNFVKLPYCVGQLCFFVFVERLNSLLYNSHNELLRFHCHFLLLHILHHNQKFVYLCNNTNPAQKTINYHDL